MFRYFLIFLLLSTGTLYSQEFNWSAINADNSELPNQTIKTISVDSEDGIWFGTYMGGVAYLKDGQWTIFNTSNSELPHNYVNTIAIDKNNVKWIGTDGGGLARFDGSTWEIYKTSNSGLPSNVVMSVFCDDDGSIWIGTYFGGLAHLDNGLWTIYSDENSPLLSNKVVCITKDQNNVIWVGTQGGGAASFDRKNWNVYTERNSKLTNDYIYSIAVDNENKKWIGTGGGGLAVFNDVFWIKYGTVNSGLTDDNIRPIIIDEKNNKWIGTYIGGINLFDGKIWAKYDFQNSAMPDDEITCMTYHKNNIYVGTERSGIIQLTDLNPVQTETTPAITTPLVVKTETKNKSEKKPENKTEIETKIDTNITPVVVLVPDPDIKQEEENNDEIVAGDIVLSPDEISETDIAEDTIAKEEIAKKAMPAMLSIEPQNRIVLMMDAADLYFDQRRINEVIRSYKFLLVNREHINSNYDVKILLYSSNYDVSPKKINFEDKDLQSLQVKDVILMEGENTFTEALKKAFNLIKNNYNENGNNQVFAASYKFIRDDETATVVTKNNLDNHAISFNLLAFNTESWKLEYKMRNIVPKDKGYYYSINKPGIKDNWSVTGMVGLSIFRGDIDVDKFVRFPGMYGFAAQKKLHSTGMLNGGVKGQLNFGQFKGEKNNENFKNSFFEASINLQVIMNRWINRNFKFEKYRPYAFAGVGLISYRSLLWDSEGKVVNGYGYDVTEGNTELNGTNPNKTKRTTEFIIPLGAGVNYKLNELWNIELEFASRFINSDKLDAKIRYKNDKYWFVTIGITYKINSKDFLADILSK
ncbi:MAG: two-component regulator propeller domain-containing protein [Bacteroidales bacterium]